MDTLGSAQMQDHMGRAVEAGVLPHLLLFALCVGPPPITITSVHMWTKGGPALYALPSKGDIYTHTVRVQNIFNPQMAPQ